MERTLRNSERFQLHAGRYYCTEGGDLIFIQRLDGKRRVACGFYIDGHEVGQWYLDGRFSSIKTDNDITCEVIRDEISNRNTKRCPECGLSR
jgi:hypothetical protein